MWETLGSGQKKRREEPPVAPWSRKSCGPEEGQRFPCRGSAPPRTRPTMVQAAGPAPVYIRVRQKTNRKKGVLPPAWSPTFRPTRTGTPVSPHAAAGRGAAALPAAPRSQPGIRLVPQSINETSDAVAGRAPPPNAPGTEGPCAIELRAHALRKRIESLEKAPRRDKVKRQEALKSLKRYKREYNRMPRPARGLRGRRGGVPTGRAAARHALHGW